MRSGAYSEIPAAIKVIARGVEGPDKNPGRDLRLARDLCSPLNGVGTLTCRVRHAPPVAAEAEAVGPGRCLSPGSPIRPGRSASPVRPEAAVAAEAGAAEAALRPLRRSYR